MEKQTTASKWLVNAVKETEHPELTTLLSGARGISVCWTPNRLGVHLSVVFRNVHNNLAQHGSDNLKPPVFFTKKLCSGAHLLHYRRAESAVSALLPLGLLFVPLSGSSSCLELQHPYLSPYYGNARHCILNCKLCWGFGNVKVFEGKFIYLTKMHVACDLITALSKQLTKKSYLSWADS